MDKIDIYKDIKELQTDYQIDIIIAFAKCSVSLITFILLLNARGIGMLIRINYTLNFP
jgi:hypothetical protein